MPEWKPKHKGKQLLRASLDKALSALNEGDENLLTALLGIEYSDLRDASLEFSDDPAVAVTLGAAPDLDMAMALAYASGVMAGIIYERENDHEEKP